MYTKGACARAPFFFPHTHEYVGEFVHPSAVRRNAPTKHAPISMCFFIMHRSAQMRCFDKCAHLQRSVRDALLRSSASPCSDNASPWTMESRKDAEQPPKAKASFALLADVKILDTAHG